MLFPLKLKGALCCNNIGLARCIHIMKYLLILMFCFATPVSVGKEREVTIVNFEMEKLDYAIQQIGKVLSDKTLPDDVRQSKLGDEWRILSLVRSQDGRVAELLVLRGDWAYVFTPEEIRLSTNLLGNVEYHVVFDYKGTTKSHGYLFD